MSTRLGTLIGGALLGAATLIAPVQSQAKPAGTNPRPTTPKPPPPRPMPRPDDAAHKAEEEARRRSEEAARRRAEEEKRRRAEEAARRRMDENARRKAEEAARRRAEAKALEAARRKAEAKAQETARRKAEEAARRRAEARTAEAARRRAESKRTRPPDPMKLALLRAERKANLAREARARRAQEQRWAEARKAALARLDPQRRRQAELALARARQRQQASRRPIRSDNRFIAMKQTVQNAPGGKKTVFKLSPGELGTLTSALNGSSDPRDRRLLRDITQSRLLSRGDILRARERIRDALTATPPNPALAHALRNALDEDRRRKFMQGVLDALIRLGGPGGGLVPIIPVFPGGTILVPGSLSGGGCSIIPPPGIDPCGPALVWPSNPDDPGGTGIVTSIDPGTIDPGPSEENGDGASTDTEVQADAVWHTTRNLRVSNGTREKIKVKVQYEAIDTSDQAGWYPQSPEEGTRALEFELQPGEVANLKDGTWPINASRVRISAQSGDRQWQQFRDRDLELVPERDERGNRGYASAEVQTFNVAFR